VKRVRLDKLMIERGLAQSRERARELIDQGSVTVGGMVARKAGTMVSRDTPVEVSASPQPYVSRGGLKLAQALDHFTLPCAGRVVMDVGASTGGFTDCVLQRGAARVYAIDVGYGQLAWKLRQDPRVVVMERVNIRTLPRDAIQDPVDLAVVDCSFIGLNKVLRPTSAFLSAGADVVALLKPQFEVGRAGLGKGGVVRDSELRREAIARVAGQAGADGFDVLGGVDCETHGPKGNVEYLLWLRYAHTGEATDSMRAASKDWLS